MLLACHGCRVDLSQEAAAVIAQLGGSTSAELVWVNPLAGRTYQLTGPRGTQFLKLSPNHAPDSHDVLSEAERLEWARDMAKAAAVPVVLETGTGDHVHWMLTEGLPGVPASDRRWRSDPRRTGRLLGYAVRAFHDALAQAVNDCPWSWRIADRLAARPDSLEAQTLAADVPEEADLVVGHGDLCAPNILLNQDGSAAGYVDLGKLGVADRASDLGCHVWSLEYNELGEGIDDFLAAYGHHVDRATVQWYRDFYMVA